jgi:hypothetical protein
MSNPHHALTADGGPDDLPRTLRREKEAREREALARDTSNRGGALAAEHAYPVAEAPAQAWPEDTQPAVVTAVSIPFFRLMAFFIKAVFAAIPALIILGAMLWGAGHLLQQHFPWIVKMRILIHFPG